MIDINAVTLDTIVTSREVGDEKKFIHQVKTSVLSETAELKPYCFTS